MVKKDDYFMVVKMSKLQGVQIAINTTSISLAFYHSECTTNLFQVHTTNMFPQSTSVFTSAVTKLTKKRFQLQMKKFINVVEIVE